MPPWVFWGLFLMTTGYYLISKIYGDDLWWHIACGRFFLENGFYPPTDTFTFSPVRPVSPNIKTWLGDLFLFGVYKVGGGEIGLHIFQMIAIIVPVKVMLVLSGNRYNGLTLLTAVLIVIGTMQQQILKNSIFTLIFLPLIILLWFLVKEKKKEYLLIGAPIIIGLWTYMHGYALVGMGILSFIFLGELFDQLMQKERRRPVFLAFFFIVVIASAAIVKTNLNFQPYTIVKEVVRTLFGPSYDPAPMPSSVTTTAADDSKDKIQGDPSLVLEESGPPSFKESFKLLFRGFMKGGDAEYIEEFKSPFDGTSMLFVKALFILCVVYGCYLVATAVYFKHTIRLSYVFPSLASLYLGLGYLRTTGFPFQVALPFMVAGIAHFTSPPEANANSRIKGMVSGGGGLPLLNMAACFICLFLMVIQPFYLYQKQFNRVTGLVTVQPGIGRSDETRSSIPRFALERFPNENLFNSYNVGGSLIWSWYGMKKVFIDSRSIDYAKEFYDDYTMNYGLKYIEKMGLKHGIFSIVNDFEWYDMYMSQNWNVTFFDASMTLIERRTEEGYDQFYGKVPRFIGDSADIESLTYVSRVAFGRFLDNTLKYMLHFGRLKDTFDFYEHIKPMLEALPEEEKTNLALIYRSMAELRDRFDAINNPVLAEVTRKLVGVKDPGAMFVVYGDALRELKQDKKAVSEYIAAARVAPNNIERQILVGDIMMQMKYINLAISQYEIAVKLNPDLYHEYNKIGFLYFQLKKYGEAEMNFRKAMEKNPRMPESYINLGTLFEVLDRPQEAIAVYREGISMNPGNQTLTLLLDQVKTH